MKITKVTPLLIDRYLFVTIETDEGITGLGESGAWGFLEASHAAIEKFGRYLAGKDPLLIEHHWQYMYRYSHFRGAAIMGAISALDIALWDIAGKFLNVPVYQLLGGKVREKARVYSQIFGRTREEILHNIKDAVQSGFTAVGHLTPFLDGQMEIPYVETHSRKITDAVEAVKQYRETVGNDVDMCIEIQRRLTPAEAIQLGLEIQPFHPLFYEDPIPPDNIDAMAYVASKINLPIATGERFISIQEFEMALSRNAVQFVRPCMCTVGGISAAKKIAALAEARYAGVVPHNPLSPVSTAACLQIAACIPNFTIQEYPGGEDAPPKSEIVKGPLQYDGKGFLIIPDRPGIGVELNPDAVAKYPPKPFRVRTRLNMDGSVTD